MQYRHAFKAVDRLLQDIPKVKQMFGGISALTGSDWQQCLPVVPKAPRAGIISATLRRSYIWPRLRAILRLAWKMRLPSVGINCLFSQLLARMSVDNTMHGILELPDYVTDGASSSVEELLAGLSSSGYGPLPHC
jgi:hypothetical protein